MSSTLLGSERFHVTNPSGPETRLSNSEFAQNALAELVRELQSELAAALVSINPDKTFCEELRAELAAQKESLKALLDPAASTPSPKRTFLSAGELALGTSASAVALRN